MGSHMAVNLMKGGHNVTVFDIVKSQVDAVVAEGKLLINIQQFWQSWQCIILEFLRVLSKHRMSISLNFGSEITLWELDCICVL